MNALGSNQQRLTWTNTTEAAVTKYQVIALADVVGVAATDIAIGATGALWIAGDVEMPANPATVINDGDVVYIDTATGIVDTTGPTALGIARMSKPAGRADLRVLLYGAAGAGAGESTPPEEGGGGATVRYIVFTLTAGVFHNSLGYEAAIIAALKVYATDGGTDLALAATVTPDNFLAGYAQGGLNDGNVGTNWANGAAMPTEIVVDLGAGNEIDGIYSYSFTNANDSGNAVYFPTAWSVAQGSTSTPGAGLVAVESQTGQSFASLSETKTYVAP